MLADLHTHSTASDGQLSPTALVQKAIEAGVEMLAITDHDTVGGIASISNYAQGNIQLIPGLELSAFWRNTGIHIVGLNIDLNNDALSQGIRQQQQARGKRAVAIAEKLENAGFSDVLDGARQLAGNECAGRPHFARFLVDSGQIKDIKTAFKRYLGRGKACDIKNCWASLEDVTRWISAAGGMAVLAHPAKYKMSNMRLEELCKEFVVAGGHAIEVISGAQDATLTDKIARLATRHGLLASCGSDFHQPGQPWAELGRAPALPSMCRPVWEHW
jgi:predicted metal-dependent phosphoesterase TrpH